MVEQAVEQRGGHDKIAEHLAPFGKAAVGGQDHRTLLIAGIDELEEQVAAAGHDRQIADLVHDQERGAAEIPDALAQGAVALGLGQGGDEIGQGREGDAAAGFDRLDGERYGEVALAGAGWAEQMDDLGPIDELEFSQGEDAFAVEGGLEAEVEALQRLNGCQTRHHQGGLYAAALAQREFLDQDLVGGTDFVDLTLLDAPERSVEDL